MVNTSLNAAGDTKLLTITTKQLLGHQFSDVEGNLWKICANQAALFVYYVDVLNLNLTWTLTVPHNLIANQTKIGTTTVIPYVLLSTLIDVAFS